MNIAVAFLKRPMPDAHCAPWPAVSTAAKSAAARDPVATWLAVCCLMVAVMVALGGLTRLTGSGLSMVEWNPHHVLPPLNDADWREAFGLYQGSPQYKLVNSHLDLDGFKGIFWLEYVHRLWGRAIGLVFALPLAWFAVRGLLDRALTLRLSALLALGAAQGGLGWFMVASGLVDRPEVSHYRLAAHLLLALALLAALTWTLLDRIRPKPATYPHGAVARRLYAALAALAVLVMSWGAFVAGLKAGLVHQTFPLMGADIFPDDGLLMVPAWRNAFENPSAVQYVHRILALTLLLCANLAAAWAWANRLPGTILAPMCATAAWLWVQAGLGVATLLSGVAIPLATLHQTGAVVLVCLLTWSLHASRQEKA